MVAASLSVTVRIKKSWGFRCFFFMAMLMTRLAVDNARLRLVMRKHARLKAMETKAKRDREFYRVLLGHLDEAVEVR